MTQTVTADPYSQAMRAYFEYCMSHGEMFKQPASYSGIREYEGKQYVVLENICGPLGVYLIGPDGELEDISLDYDSWPAALREQYPVPDEDPDAG